ncbi:uncharacterized protein PHACADRAFT_187291 [Phanerochaete carnosa HHB-10118-sp]|uniref:ABM domain-containing protein n=1 Tax=Phanerochaete carnosa (strain HHB-10118-sp) TaxID=650164 RepID=K5WNL6_PHACS|nr:uncharacterized protein PHACADRAFT_187291 [Phanerochaete carnosa HHB-10118-sp]EKM51902.1 hypothetical protein PHACADRAFT_187291 [Phanerochaete carnosa HHB-10118-sp]
MPLPVAEIAKIVASDAYRADYTVINEVFEILTETPGFVGIWHGLTVQEPQYLYVVILWETVEHHRALMEDQVVYPAFNEKMRKVSNGRVWKYHVHFNNDTDKALSAPVTEFALTTAEDSTEVAGHLETADISFPLLYKTLPDEIFESGWGPTVESDRKFMICLGWHSLELTAQMFQLPEVDAMHAKLTKC